MIILIGLRNCWLDPSRKMLVFKLKWDKKKMNFSFPWPLLLFICMLSGVASIEATEGKKCNSNNKKESFKKYNVNCSYNIFMT